MQHAENLNSTRVGTIEHEDFFEARNTEDSQASEFRNFETGMPSYLRILSQQEKRLMRREEKTVADFGACLTG
jgi:hypothetical protein